MIIDVQKHLVIGVKEDLDLFFERAQQRGFVEFISPSGKLGFHPTEAIDKLMAAGKILRKQANPKTEQKAGSREEALKVAEETISLKAKIEHLLEEMRITRTEIVRVSPLGEFSLDDLEYLKDKGNRVVQFFCIKSYRSDALGDHPELIYLGTEYDLDYYMSISPQPLKLPQMVEIKIDYPVQVLRDKYASLEKEFHDAEHSLKQLTAYIELLHDFLIEDLNEYHLASAKKSIASPLNNTLFTVEAWIPKNKVHALYGMIQGMAIHVEPIAIEENEKVPTCLENKGLNRVGEDLVHIYDIPSTTDKDPSAWVLWSFCLFFAMIVADAGYGLVFLTLAIFLKLKMPKLKGAGQRFLKLLGLLAVSCIVWGVLTTSYFGLNILPDNPLSKISMVNYLAEKKAEYHLVHKDTVYEELLKEYPAIQTAKNGREILDTKVISPRGSANFPILDDFRDSIFLELSLLIGVIHIVLSLGRNLRRSWAGLGWIIFIIGGFLYFPSKVHATSLVNYLQWMTPDLATAMGLQMVYIGICAAVLFALIQKKLKGLLEIMNVITVFSDVLSYLRLYALALAATIMADTFNEIGGGVGLALGALVIIAGHSINILLGTMGGVIHGLRLNFIEWYHHCFEGGGRLFAPLHKMKSN